MQYRDKINLDLSGLPNYLHRDLLNHFTFRPMRKDDEYREWKYDLDQFIGDFPKEDAIKFLEYGLMYMQKSNEWHTEHECPTKETGCVYDTIWNRRKNITNKILEEQKAEAPAFSFNYDLSSVLENDKNSEFTTARQVLAMKFLFEYAKIKIHNDKAAERFINFLTGKSSKNIYDLWRQPYKDVYAEKKKDLRFVKKYFEDMELSEIVKMIDNEINSI